VIAGAFPDKLAGTGGDCAALWRQVSVPERQVLLEHVGFLRAIALGVLRNEADADDVVQQTLATALQKPPADDSNLRGWLATVARNFARMQLRSRSRRQAREEKVARNEGTPSTAHIAQRMEMERHVVDAIATLEEPFRTTLVLRYYDDLQPKDIAVRMGVPAATVRTRLKRGLDKLRVRLEEKSGGNKKAMYAGLLLLAQLPARAAPPLRWVPVAGVAAIVLCVVGVAWLVGESMETTDGPGPRRAAVARDEVPEAEPTPAKPVVSTCSVAGRVMDRLGTSLADVEVIAYEHAGPLLIDSPLTRWDRWLTPPRELARTTTDEKGNYVLLVDPPRPFWLVYRVEEHAVRFLPIPDAVGEYTNVDIVMQEARGALGRIRDENGAPIVGAKIHAWSLEYTLFGAPALVTAETDKDGRFTLPFASTYVNGALSMLNRISLVIDARHAGYAPRVIRDEPAIFMALKLQRHPPWEIAAQNGTRVLAISSGAIDLRTARQDGSVLFPEFPRGARTLVLIDREGGVRQVELQAGDPGPSRVHRRSERRSDRLGGMLTNRSTERGIVGALVGWSPRSKSPLLFDALVVAKTGEIGGFSLDVGKSHDGTFVVAHPSFSPVRRIEFRHVRQGWRTVEIDLEPDDELHGEVVDNAGESVAGARVRIRRRGVHSNWHRGMRRLWTAVTRTDGTFVIRGVPRSRAARAHMRLEAWHPLRGAATQANDSDDVPLRLELQRSDPHAAVTRMDPDLKAPEPVEDRGMSVRGVVTDLAGHRLPNVTVKYGRVKTTSDADGWFEIMVGATLPQTITLVSGSGTQDVVVESNDFLRICVVASQSLDGRVVHAGEPVAGASVRVWFDGSTWERSITDADGKFSIRRWPAQTPRELVIEAAGFLSQRIVDPTGADIELVRAAPYVVEVVDVEGRAVNRVDLRQGQRRFATNQIGEPQWSKDGTKLKLVVRRGERITGQVLDSENGGVPHIVVVAEAIGPGRPIRRAFTNSKGHFVLRALHPERYRLRVGEAKRGVEIEAGRTDIVLKKE